MLPHDFAESMAEIKALKNEIKSLNEKNDQCK